MRRQPIVGRIKRNSQHHAPDQDGDERVQQDEGPVDQKRKQREANGDLDHLFASPVLSGPQGSFADVHRLPPPMRFTFILYWSAAAGKLDPDQCRLEAEAGPQLSRADQGAAIEAAARLFPAGITAVQAAAIEPLALQIVLALAEIDPDDSVIGAMPLRLMLVAERSEGNGHSS